MRLSIPVVAALVVVADQLSKLWLVQAIPYGGAVEVVGGLLRLVHTRNRGIAFGLFGAAGPLVQALLVVGVVVIVAYLVHQLHRGDHGRVAGAGMALVLGGAIGNLVDRVLRGEVVDFLDVFVRLAGQEYHWPAFNLADAAITVGVGLVVLAELRGPRRDRASNPR